MHGYASTEELTAQHLKIFHNQEQLENDVIPFNQKVMENGFHSGEVGHIRKDGTPFPTLMTTTILKDEQGNPYAMVGIARDITERKQAEEELLARQERLKAINEIAIEVAGTFDLNRLLQTIIDRARELVEAELGVIVLVDPDTGAIGDAFSSNYPMDKIPQGTELQGQGVLGRIAAGEVICTDDITQESGYIGYPDWIQRYALVWVFQFNL